MLSTILASSEGDPAFDLQLLGILLAVALFLLAAYRTALPYPLILVVGGALLALVPGVPEVELDPDLVLVIALPPLLYSAAFFSSLSDLRDNVRPIAMLAVGAVLVTVVGVAVVAHTIIDGLSWEAASPYFAYLPAEAAGVSAVLAAVVSGIYLGLRSPELITPQTRIQSFAVWEIVVFLLNAMLFVLLGLQLPGVLEGLDGYGASRLAWYAIAVTAAVVLLRFFLWVFLMTYLPHTLRRPGRGPARRPAPPWQYPLLISWTGMRGAVSLAAALAIPLETDAGAAFPGREIVIFCTYAVILATLLAQGLSLPYVIRWLGVEEDRGSRGGPLEPRRAGGQGTHRRRTGRTRAAGRAARGGVGPGGDPRADARALRISRTAVLGAVRRRGRRRDRAGLAGLPAPAQGGPRRRVRSDHQAPEPRRDRRSADAHDPVRPRSRAHAPGQLSTATVLPAAVRHHRTPMPREIHLHDTRTGSLAKLEPRDPGKVGIYTCGPTVYARIHIGNARPFVVFSLLKRFLQHEGYEVTFVTNITDVNDKIYAAARAAGVPSQQLATEMTAHYESDTDGLGLGRPDHEPKVVETIDGIVDLISALISRGAAYAVEGDVYFRVRADAAYGSLSHRMVDDMNQGEGGDGLSLKEDPLDFALWKAQKPGEDTAWDAPWGRGRPGWHIECSAMAEGLLGLGFEIHGGGNDLAFPHHENEAAQTRAGRGEELARIWMHNGMLQMAAGEQGDGADKMSKSAGNVALLHDVLGAYGRDAVIAYFCSAHYRQPLKFTAEALEQAVATVRRLRELGRRLSPGASPPELAAEKGRFFAALADDFRTPEALAAVFGWARDANRRLDAGERVGDADLREMLAVLALDNVLDGADGPDAVALGLLEERRAARSAKDWAAADRIREDLEALGWTVRDGVAGAELVRSR